MTDLRRSDAGWFMVLAFGMSLGMFAPMLGTPGLGAAFGPIGLTHPMVLIAVRAPAISASFLSLPRSGPNGLWCFACRLALWRIG